MNEMLSFLVGTFSVFSAFLVMKAYWPGSPHYNRANKLLVFGIFVGFFGDAVNGTWWGFFNHLLVSTELATVTTVRHYGNYIDVVAKGAITVSAILHLKALHEFLPEEEKSKWTFIEMPWYPKKLLRFCKGK